MRRFQTLTLLILLTLSVTASCGSYGSSSANRINGTNITASMTDEQIIKAFGLDPATATTKKTNGKDGTMMTYSAGEQVVNITRSTVTGVSVFATGPTSGVWDLGTP